jgi:peptidoglycan LD-endopeptidase LytH
VRFDLTRYRRRVIAAVAAATLAAACTDRKGESSTQDESSDSAGRLAHLNGAVLDSAPRRSSPPASAITSNGHSLPQGSASNPARATASNEGGTVGTATAPVFPEPVVTPPASNGRAGGSGAVAPTPDELSALAASLVVPVAGVTPSELRGSFHEPRGGGTRQHNAIDIPAPRGTPVISATSGRLLRLFTSKAGGLMIYAADATERFILLYAHLDHYAEGLTDGMRLERGQTIGYVGTTGNAPPNLPHLHFGIARSNNVSRWWNGMPIDPLPLLKR